MLQKLMVCILVFFTILAGCTPQAPQASPTATIQPSRLPDPNEVKALLVQLVDVEKRAPGIVVGMIAADPEERWVVGYGRLSATDERVPDGDTVDLLTFLAANMGMTDTGLGPALQLASTPQRPGEILAYIGLGWNLPGSGNGIHYHGGAHLGYTSFLAWDSERKIGVVVLMNVYDGPKEYLGYHLLRGLPKPFPVDPQVLAAYAGSYQFGDFIVTIRVDGARIYPQVPGNQGGELIAISENQFYLRELYAEIVFYRNDRGEVDRMEVVGIEGTLEAKKVP